MQSEKVEFTLKLSLININRPIPATIKLNDLVVNELGLGPNSNSINFIVELDDSNNYTLSFAINDIQRPSKIILNNLNISWLDNNRILKIGWRPQNPGEIWNYTDPDATAKQENIIRRAQNMDFDYFVPTTNLPGFLKKFGRFEGADGSVMQFNKLERPFGITEPGAFKLDFTTPISYWLYRNLI